MLPHRERDGEDHAVDGEVHQGRLDHHRAQERHPPDEPQAVGHLAPQRLAPGRLLWPEPPADPVHRAERRHVRDGVREERDGLAEVEKHPAKRGAGQAGAVSAGLGGRPCPLELLVRHDARQRRGGRRRENSARASLDQAHDHDDRPGREAQRDQGAQKGQQDGAHDVADDHRQPPVQPVRQCPGGQLKRYQDDRPCRPRRPREHRRVGQRQDKQRVGEPADLAAGTGQQLADPQHPEALIAPQRNRPRNIGRRLRPAGFAHTAERKPGGRGVTAIRYG